MGNAKFAHKLGNAVCNEIVTINEIATFTGMAPVKVFQWLAGVSEPSQPYARKAILEFIKEKENER